MDESKKVAICILLDLVKHGSENIQDVKLSIACLNYLGVSDNEIYASLDVSDEEIKRHINDLREIMNKYEIMDKRN